MGKLKDAYSRCSGYCREIVYEEKNFLANNHGLNRSLGSFSNIAPLVGAVSAVYLQSHYSPDLPELVIIGSAGALSSEMAYGLFLQLIGKQELENGWFGW